jgi:hypothetical protein
MFRLSTEWNSILVSERAAEKWQKLIFPKKTIHDF